MMPNRLLPSGLALLLALLGLSTAASAATGPNGLVAYAACGDVSQLGATTCDIWVVDPRDPAAPPRNLTESPDIDDGDPAWSPDGRQIAFTRDLGACNTNLWVMNANGTGKMQVTYRNEPDTHACQLEPTWSPDGNQLAFLRTNPTTGILEIVVIDVASGTERVISPPEGPTASFGALELAWSPDGGKIAFSAVRDEMMADPVTGEPVAAAQYEIVTINPDGTGEQVISAGAPGSRRAATLEEDRSPAWSPDGSRLVFMSQSQDPSCCLPWQIWVASRDGSALENVSAAADVDEMFPSWSPDGSSILFGRASLSGTDLYAMPAPAAAPLAARDGGVARALGEAPVERITRDGNAGESSWAVSRRRQDQPKTLTVVLRGGGTVTSDPEGLRCEGVGRCRQSFPAGRQVVLTATPAPGATFRGWSGPACRGETGDRCTVAMNQARVVRAQFAGPATPR